MIINDILTIYGIGNAIYAHRNRIMNFLMRYKIGRIILGIVFAPVLIPLVIIFYRMFQDPEMRRIYANVNAQKKILDYC